jgi:4-amino-4-deoxy-L-arabinose transferase-like glycosyltransferase
MSANSLTYPSLLRRASRGRLRTALWRRAVAKPEITALAAVAGMLNLWGLSVNGWANIYYAAAVRSMSTSWHDFLFASLDRTGLMTVDKPPLSLWVQALSARVFGFHPLSLLVPQALMGVLAVVLTYDLTRRVFGRPAGFAAGLALATTPIVVAVSRHNNPDELLALCCVAALWFVVRGLQDGRTKWIVLSGVCVGLGFETKMAVAPMVVPGIAAAWMWVAPRGRIASLRSLLTGGVAAVIVGGAWPLLVTLTPAADRPWISGTSDNSIWSLIFGYNGFGRIAGQSGGPGGGGGGGGGALFGGSTGPLRLLASGLGDQAGWLLGFAAMAGLLILLRSRMARRDPRTGWLMAVGGALATTTVVFSFAQGIFHPYYVSLLAPFAAALAGAGVGQVLNDRGTGWLARLTAPLLIAGGVAGELYVLTGLGGALDWAPALVIGAGGVCAVALALRPARKVRAVLVGAALGALLAAPTVWAAETLGHATNGTFPAGGPASAQADGFGRGRGPRGFGARAGGAGGAPPGPMAGAPGAGGAFQAFGTPPAAAGGFAGGPPGGGFGGGPPGGGAPGGFGGDTASLSTAIRYARSHGGGTIGVSSQSSAAQEILSTHADVAGLGGFSGRESSVSVSWLAAEVRAGRLRWVLSDAGSGPRLPGDTRLGSQTAMSAVAKACRAVSVTGTGGTSVSLYDCQARAAAIIAASRAS